MTRTHRTKFRLMGTFAALLLITGVASCSSDGYETGDDL